MTNIGTLLMKIKADNKDLETNLKKSKKSIADFSSAAKVGLIATAAAFTAVGVASVKAIQDQERAEARLESIAKTVTKATDEQIKSMKNLAAEYQNVSTFGDEVIISGQSQILSFGVSTKSAEQLTGALTDMLAANKGMTATQEDAIDAANLFGKALNGQPGALSRVGILLNDQQSALLKTGTEQERVAALTEIMNQNYGGLAKTLSETSQGQWIQFKNAIGDVGERIGSILLPTINKLVEMLNNWLVPALNKLFDWFEKNGETISNIWEAVMNSITLGVKIVSDIVTNTLIPNFETMIKWVKTNMPLLKELWKANFSIISGVVEIFSTLIRNFLIPILEKFGNWVNQNMPLIQKVILGTMKFISDSIEAAISIISALVDGLQLFYNYVSGGFKNIGENIKSAFDGVVSFIDGIITKFEKVIETVKKAVEAVKTFVEPNTSNQQGNLGSTGTGNFGDLRDFKTSGIDGNRAVGGMTQAGKSYIVGEGGKPEVFTPGTDGMITPLSKLQGDSGTSITNEFNISSIVVREEADIKKIARQLFLLQRQNERGLAI